MDNMSLTTDDLSKLSKLMSDYLSLSEVKLIAFRVGVDFDDLDDDSRKLKIISLINHCNRRGMITKLWHECINCNPKISHSSPDLDNKLRTDGHVNQADNSSLRSETINIENVTQNFNGLNQGAQGIFGTVYLNLPSDDQKD